MLSKTREAEKSDDYAKFEWEEMEREADRAWYDDEDTYQEFFKEPQAKDKTGLRGLKKMERSEENHKWEMNRMIGSGVFKIQQTSEMDEIGDNSVMVNVHDIKPPFLNGKQVFTTQLNAISVVKDATSDIAILAKKGSAVLKKLRETNDRSKMRERFWELAGSKLGNLLRIQKTEEQQDEAIFEDNGDDVDYKKSS